MGFITAGAGMMIVIAGVVVFLMRAQIAASWLGARYVFGTAVAESDVWKAMFVALNGLALGGYGGLAIVAGGFLVLEVFLSKGRKS